MTHTYIVSGITCGSCVAAVKNKLLLSPEITDAEISTDGLASISMQKHLTVTDLQGIIGIDSKYRINEASKHNNAGDKGASMKSWIATYKPLLLIGAYIAGVSALLANGSFHAGMNYFMAGFFLVFSFFKLLDLKGFASSYATYDLLAMRVPAYGLIYPFIELMLGAAYAVGFKHVVTNWTTLIVMGFSSAGVIRSVMRKQKIRCACLGAVFNPPMSTVTIVEDILMVAMAVYMLTTI